MKTEETSRTLPIDAQNGATKYDDENGPSMIDLLLVLARNRIIIAVTVGISVGLGVLVAVIQDDEYTSRAVVIREVYGESSQNLGALAALRGFGISIGGATTGLTAEAYPDLVKSREVRLAVASDTFPIPSLGRNASFIDYVDSRSSWFSTLSGAARRTTSGGRSQLPNWGVRSGNETSAADDSIEFSYPTEEEENALRVLSNILSTSVDDQTGLMTIQVTTEDPVLSAALAASFLDHLTDRVRVMRTQKSRETLEFMQERFAEASLRLRSAEEDLARFLDRNTSPQTAQLRTELERLQRNVTFSSQLYSDLQTQVTQAEIELQRSQPVITVVEKPLPPTRPSGPARWSIILVSFLLGSIVAIGLAFMRSAVKKQTESSREREKVQEILGAFLPQKLYRRFSSTRGRHWESGSPEVET